MKQIINTSEAYEKMNTAINLLCNTVKITLGPRGKNVIIAPNYMSPFITNDGVTIAKEIDSEDIFEKAILEIAKEASIKTNDEVGDGTTTSLVLLQSIFNKGLEKIKNGYNPMILKKELDESLDIVTKEIEKCKIKACLKDITAVASISANDKAIGILIGEAYKKVGENGLITVDESKDEQTKFELISGMEVDTSLISEYMLKNKNEDKIKDSYLLITNAKIKNLNQLNNLLNDVIDSRKSLLIICEDMSNEVQEALTLNRYQNILDVIAVKIQNYGDNKLKLLEDIAIFTKGKFINTHLGLNLEDVTISDLGMAKEIKVNKSKIVVVKGNGNIKDITNRKKEIKKELLNSNQFTKEFLEKRISSFEKGVGVIYVGGNSKTEMIEKKMRIIDALSSSKIALKEGVLEGAGLTLIKVSNLLQNKNNTLGMNIILEALNEPFKTIINNIGLNPDEIYHNIKEDNFISGFNALTEKYVPLYKEGIIDPVKVTVNALINATSVATMLLTSGAIIASPIKEEIDVEKVF